MPTSYLVAGASRGIGLEFVRQLAQQDENVVYGTVRNLQKAASLTGQQELKRAKWLQLDTNEQSQVDQAAKQVDELDVLIVNAAIGGEDLDLMDTQPSLLSQYLENNVVGPHRIILAFLDALQRGKQKKIILISSRSGSLDIQANLQQKHGSAGPYSVTKAAINMSAIQLARELKPQGFIVNPLSPGWVSTDMGNKIVNDKAMPVEQSVGGMLNVIRSLTLENSATFYHYDGSVVPW
ncbi:Predicted short chain-type dehydrogenase [Ceraceosorus bombacis]|uniref:Predicted short chain-type dehydrogenase n=1 Tax=Ceraceosorus bombacis TaxID=401625 RepID=A0A0P1BGX8_9BASI|nr:Predicted short chain-type dehydrogenase [Ceraceosorus bombacis]